MKRSKASQGAIANRGTVRVHRVSETSRKGGCNEALKDAKRRNRAHKAAPHRILRMKSDLSMEVDETIQLLRNEREKLDGIIVALGQLKSSISEAYALRKKRRGRKSMGPDERRRVSERMKAYWAQRRSKRS